MRREATNTNGNPTPSSVALGNWVILVRLSGVKTPLDQLSNEEVDLILARVSELAGEKQEGEDVR